MLTLREHLGLAPVFGGVHVAHLVSFLCCVVFLLFLSSSCVYMFKQIITLTNTELYEEPQNRMKRQNRYPRTKRHDHSLSWLDTGKLKKKGGGVKLVQDRNVNRSI